MKVTHCGGNYDKVLSARLKNTAMPNTIKLRCLRKCSLKWTSNALTPYTILEEIKIIICNKITDRIQGSSTNNMSP
jgi:hypothetical protein